MINFTEPSITKTEKNYVLDALNNNFLSGDKKYTRLCTEWFNNLGYGTSALELSAILSQIKPGDEFIVPSFTFSSTANAFMLRGAKPVFAEINPNTMNIDVTKIEDLITPKTVAIVPIDYAGIPCDIDKINKIAKKHGLTVIEDSAQAIGSKYKDTPCGLKADIACFSFHETKNITMGEGGGIYIKDDQLMEKAEIIREKGTNRKQFIHGQVDKYTWRMIGSSFLPSDILSAILYAQLERFDEIINRRLDNWNQYYYNLKQLEDKHQIQLPRIPSYAKHNAHIFFILTNDQKTRDELMHFLKDNGINTTFHYLPLHSAPLGQKYGYKSTDLPITENAAGRLLRLPLHHNLTNQNIEKICNQINTFFEAHQCQNI